MTITQLKQTLLQHSARPIQFVLPDENIIPSHFHITEVGHVRKEFIDCGGTRRTTSACVLQAWTMDGDEDHSLQAGKLARILDLAAAILPDDEDPVEVEFEAPYISQFPVVAVTHTADTLVFQLGTKRTDCLAKERCGVANHASPGAKSGCC